MRRQKYTKKITLGYFRIGMRGEAFADFWIERKKIRNRYQGRYTGRVKRVRKTN